MTCELRTVESRWSKANDDAEVDDDKRAEFNEQSANNSKIRATLSEFFENHEWCKGRVKLV